MAIVVATAVLAGAAATAHASRFLRVGIYDEAQVLYGPVPATFRTFVQLHVQEVRLNLYWGGAEGVATRRPANPTNPDDPAYDWSVYDRTVNFAAQSGEHVLFSVYGTPGWANGGKGMNVAPTNANDLKNFAIAAARRYSGIWPGADGRILPPVKEWLAWNEPNNPIFLAPQYKKTATGWTIQSAKDYARICNAVYSGVHSTMTVGERVACGGTAPRGNNNPSTSRSSVSPLAFLAACKKDGLKTFDAWAHHPYYSSAKDTPTTVPKPANGAQPTAITLGNISALIKLVTHLYGNKRIWITEYGYQTNPPDPIFGVSWAKQALYLTEAFQIAAKNPRIDMMLWFLLKDEPTLGGWQSGLITYGGKKKPAFTAYQKFAASQ
ncbi:MAG TPA: hypothetical protein VGH52_05740 [Gaiellaceae bacterium]